MAQYIKQLGIHILLDWDGYSNNGLRPTGLFAMQTSPLAINHQEFLGSMGGNFTQYVITDKVASPQPSESFHSEKFIWLPHCFFINSMPHLYPNLPRPVRDIPAQVSPEQRGCGGPPASFVVRQSIC
jgi:predicted O-linked N-acetylglucosamine transferase (SPINDLY family)